MPVGYLISVLLLLVPTALAVVPLKGSWTLGQISWRLGFQISELPTLAAVWLVFWTVFAALEGDLATTGGLAVLALAILTLAGLALLVRRAGRARSVVADALRTTPGMGCRSRPTVEIERRVLHRPSTRSYVMPLAVRRRNVAVVRNLPYGPARPEQLLDLYRSPSSRRPGPCLVHLHGGGYRGGHKSRESRALLYRLAREGWLCASANYRLPLRSRYPTPVIDAKAVIAWVREHAGDYGGDPATVFVSGSSAGAHLAAVAALTANDPSLQPGFEAADTSVAGAVCLYGFYATPTWVDLDPDSPSSPLELVHRFAPPMFVAHGDRDSFVPVIGARRFVERLRTISDSPVVYAELPGAQHTFDLYHSIRFEAVIDGIEGFAEWVAPGARRVTPGRQRQPNTG